MKIKIKTKITEFLRIRYQQTSIKCDRLAYSSYVTFIILIKVCFVTL